MTSINTENVALLGRLSGELLGGFLHWHHLPRLHAIGVLTSTLDAAGTGHVTAFVWLG
jgi:hypothetical protein